MTTPSALNTALAEESLGRCQGGCTEVMDGRVFHSRHCPLFYVPAVALALQSKDDSAWHALVAASLEIDRLKARVTDLSEALRYLRAFPNAPKAHESATKVLFPDLQTDGGKL